MPSISQALYDRAQEEGISSRRVDACFEKMTEYAERNHINEPPGCVEKLVWEHYCKLNIDILPL
jgi:hypothetical protein